MRAVLRTGGRAFNIGRNGTPHGIDEVLAAFQIVCHGVDIGAVSVDPLLRGRHSGFAHQQRAALRLRLPLEPCGSSDADRPTGKQGKGDHRADHLHARCQRDKTHLSFGSHEELAIRKKALYAALPAASSVFVQARRLYPLFVVRGIYYEGWLIKPNIDAQ